MNLIKKFLSKFGEIQKHSLFQVLVSYDIEKYVDIKDALNFINIYLQKISSQNVKVYVSKLLKEGYVKCALVKSNPYPDYAVVTAELFKDKEFNIYILIEIDKNLEHKLASLSNDLENINEALKQELQKYITEYISDNIKNITYSIYQEYIRWSILKNINLVKYDKELLKLVSKLFTAIIIKIFGKEYAPTINEDLVRLATLGVLYIIAVDLLKFDSDKAYKLTIEVFKDDNKFKRALEIWEKEFKDKNLSKYETVKDLPNILSDLNILNLPALKFNLILANSLGTKVYIDLLSSIGGLVSNLSIVHYPIDYLPKKLIISNFNEKLEEYVYQKYLPKGM